MTAIWMVSGTAEAFSAPDNVLLVDTQGQLIRSESEVNPIPDMEDFLWTETLAPRVVVLVATEAPFAAPLLEMLPENLPRVVLMSPQASAQVREQLDQISVAAILSLPLNIKDFVRVIDKVCDDRQTLQELQAQLTSYSNLAFTAMSSASEMGTVALFAEKAQGSASLPGLAKLILTTLGDLSLNGVVQFSFEDDLSIYPETASDAYRRLLNWALDSGNRIVSQGRFLLFNFEQVQLLVVDAPADDPDRYGRLRDVLAHVVSIAEARARTLKVNSLLKSQQENTRMVMALLQMASQDNRHSVKEIMTELSLSLRTMAMGMDLNLEQEGELLSLAEKALNSLEELQETTQAVEEHFHSLLEQLDDAANLLDNAGEQGDVPDVEDTGKIELF